MSISSDEVNLLVFRYLLESGFSHSAFTFAHESLVSKSVVSDADVPTGALLSFLQKGLQFCEVETHLQEDGTERACDEPFHLLTHHVCRVKTTPMKPLLNNSGKDDIVSLTAPSHSAHSAEAFVVSWNPVKNVFASGGADATAKIWTVTDQKLSTDSVLTLRHTPPVGSTEEQTHRPGRRDVTCMEWSPDGSKLATGCADNCIRIWSSDGNLLATLSQHISQITTVRWSPSGIALLSTSFDKNVVIWSIASFEAVYQYSFHTAPVLDAVWIHENSFATCSTDKQVLVCNVGERSPSRVFSGHLDEVNSVSYCPSRRLLASGSDDGTVRVWSLDAAVDADAQIGIFNLSNLSDPSAGAYSRRGVYKVLFSNAGSVTSDPDAMKVESDITEYLAAIDLNGAARVWSVSSILNSTTDAPAPSVASYNVPNSLLYALSFSPDVSSVAFGGSSSQIFILPLNGNAPEVVYSGPASVFDLQFKKDGKTIAAAFGNGAVSLVDVSPQK